LSRFIDERVQSTLEVIEERPRGFKVASSTSEKVIVDLDSLWA
jgi:hypothetical protein